MNSTSKTFCILPWTRLVTYTNGSVLLCCVAKNDLNLNLNNTSLSQAWNSKQINTARKKMLAGEKVSSCAQCYKEENVGYQSHRLTENHSWELRFGKKFLKERILATSKDGSIADDMISIDLRLGNTCNLTCIMCKPDDSSKWVSLAKNLKNNLRNEDLFNYWDLKSKINQSQFDWYKSDVFWRDLNLILPSIQELIIGGGEPMLLEQHNTLINACVSSGHASHIQLRYHTNGTVLNDTIFDTWKQFKLVEVFVSLDSIDEQNFYMRYPADWNIIKKNLFKLDSYPHKNLQIRLMCSVHLMSVFFLADYATWVENQNFKLISFGADGYFNPSVVHNPEYLSIQVLPKEIKALVADKIRAFEAISKKPSSKIDGIINFMNEKDTSTLLEKTKEYLRALDQARGTSFASVFPELNYLLKFS